MTHQATSPLMTRERRVREAEEAERLLLVRANNVLQKRIIDDCRRDNADEEDASKKCKEAGGAQDSIDDDDEDNDDDDDDSSSSSLEYDYDNDDDDSADPSVTEKNNEEMLLGGLPCADDSLQDFYDQHNDLCEVCGQPGLLLCCAMCNLVSHMHCAGLQEEPLNNWMCAVRLLLGR